MTSGDAIDGSLFRTRDAAVLGVSKRQLTKSVGRRLTHGIYASDPQNAGFDVRARAVLEVSGASAVLSHFTAAEVLGGVVPQHSQIHLTTPKTKRVQRIGVIAHRTRRPVRSTEVRGIRVTTGLQTFLDLGGSLDLVDLVVLGDSLVAAQATTPAELRAGAAEWRGVGVALVRRAAEMVRASVRSPMESRLRMLIVLAGLPEPVIDHRLYNAAGRLKYRLDLAYVECKLGVEYDGRQHAESVAQWNHDLRRREEFDHSGWRLVIVNSQQLYRAPATVLDRIVVAGRSQGLALPTPNTLWRRYFRPISQTG